LDQPPQGIAKRLATQWLPSARWVVYAVLL